MNWATIKEWILGPALATLILLLIINGFVVYFSPAILGKLPLSLVQKMDKCYLTLYHTDQSGDVNDKSIVLVTGDSYSAGDGDEFLSGDKSFGFIRKLANSGIDEHYLVYGRSGYGNMTTVREVDFCSHMLRKYTTLDVADNDIQKILMVFYEGNDLNDNLRDIKRATANNRKRYIMRYVRFLTPVYDVIRWLPIFMRELVFPDSHEGDEIPYPGGKKSVNGISIPIIPQSAATELDANEIETSLNVLVDSLKRLQEKYTNASLEILYLPSVASSYEFDGELIVYSYKGADSFNTTASFNRARSNLIRSRVQTICGDSSDCTFCDVTDRILDASKKGLPLHGPKDWKHFNKRGYEEVAAGYIECLVDHSARQ